jgi:DNA-directed RNA polymerase subunit M/transcription elongation factor TFIIS
MPSLSFTQKLIQMISSKPGLEAMQKESKTWMVQCSNCKYEKSIWDLGGIRSGAAGNPKTYMKCTNCQQRNWHNIYKKED